jgi:aryl-alcohol dehydrogenase-like predicted oxidoreductase
MSAAHLRYLAAVAALERLARERYVKSVLALAVRWVLDAPGVSVALWGARSPEQLEPVDEVFGWSLDGETNRAIDEILRKVVTDPVGPEFMASPARAPLRAMMRGMTAS